MGEDGIQIERRSITDGHESQELHVPDPPDPSQVHTLSQPEPDGVCAITVLTLLDQLVKMLDRVQEDQSRLEQRQAQVEGAVLGIQNNITKLSKNHSITANTLSKLLDKSRKVSVHMKEVRDRMEKQAVQVKKLEANHAHLLHRNNFRVLIFQDETEIPSSVFVKDPPPFPRDAENESVTLDPNRSQEELHTIQLSSDEELGPEEEEEDEEEEYLGVIELAGEHVEKSRAEKIKRSSLKKVDSLKKAFSRQNIEKKMNKIVSPEKREKIKKSLTPSHQKNPGAKSSSFKVSPLFGRKKVKEVKEEPEGEQPAEAESSSIAAATIELDPINSPDQNLTFTQVHSQLAPDQQELKATFEAMEKEEVVMEKEEEVMEKEEVVMEKEEVAEGVSEEYALSATLPQDASPGEISHNALHREEEEEYEDQEKERYEGAVQSGGGAVES
ncbi:caveolae-associated protein 2b [Colossoma macropomum]|uniref:caveolae-associated protein 2b n=1 Tax=Colossoma macropomum TaxID=42526 RepID=UPI001863E85F|nr:caveolae-associated protein 2b [Colossoma macropomum]